MATVKGAQQTGLLPTLTPPPSPPSAWVNVTGNLANMASACGNVSLLSSVPGSNTTIAGIVLDGMWANNNGSTWSHLGIGAGSALITHGPTWVVYDPANPSIFWTSGIYYQGGIYKTTNGGYTFQKLGTITHNDYVSVDFSDPNRQTLLAGGHEQSRTVYKSTDGGQTWTNIGVNLPVSPNFSGAPLIIDSQTYLVSVSQWGGGAFGVYRTTNGGSSWQQVSAQGPGGAPLVTAKGTIYWPLNNGLLKSTDSGLTWTQGGSGLQAVHPIELPDGNLASIGGSNLMISADGGSTWSPIGATLPYAPVGLVYSPSRSAFFIWHADCGNFVLPDAVMSLSYAPSIPSAPVGVRILSDQNPD